MRFFIIIVLLLFIVFFVFSGILLTGEYKKSIENEMIIRSKFTLKALENKSTLDLILSDTISLKKVSKDFLKYDDDLKSITYYDKNKSLLIGNIKEKIVFNKNDFFFKNYDNEIISALRVSNNKGYLIGYICINYKKEAIESKVANLKYELFVIALVFMFLMSILVITLLKSILKSSATMAEDKIKLEVAYKNNKMQRSFLANMSHELRTPLNAILGFSTIVKKNSKDKDIQTNINYVLDASESMLALINDILDFSKIESGKLEIDSSDFDMHQAITSVCDVLEPKVPDQVYFKREIFIQDSNRFVHGDYHRIKQVFTNLINNAIKYTNKGEVLVKCSTKLVNDKVELFFSVKDTGIGIDEKSKNIIFQAFRQVHKQEEINRDILGTGLGLSIVKELLKLMDGDIWFESEKGKGSCFYIKVAFPRGSNTIKQDKTKIESQRLNKLSVLVAEDYLLNQLLIEKQLHSMGITVDIAENGLVVIDKLKSKDYDLILMDIQMPEMGGIEATKFIRKSNLKQSAIPIIALTANAVKGDKEYYLECGMNGYVSKPVNTIKLAEEIKVTLNIKEQINSIDFVEEKKDINIKKLLNIMGNDKDHCDKILKMFIKSVQDEVVLLNRYKKKKDESGIGEIAHKFKSIINILGNNSDIELLKKMDELKSSNLTRDTDLLINMLNDYKTKSINFINKKRQ